MAGEIVVADRFPKWRGSSLYSSSTVARRFLLFLGIFFLITEIILRMALNYDPLLNKIYTNNDSWWRLKWIKKQAKYPDIQYYQPFDVYDKTKGWISKPNLKNFPAFGGKHVSTNSLGLRALREYSFGNIPDKKRIIILGDSFTFGEGVDDRENYPYFLEKIFPNVEVINFGVHGYGHDQMLILLKELAGKLKPDIVILGFLGIDMERNLSGFRDFAKPQFKLENDKLELVDPVIKSPEEIKRQEIFSFKIIDTLNLFASKISEKNGNAHRKAEIITRKLLEEIHLEIKKANAIPVFIYLPVGSEISSEQEILPYEGFLFDFCHANKISCTSLRSDFKAKADQGIDFGIGHWPPDGHQVAAQAIAKFLVQIGIL